MESVKIIAGSIVAAVFYGIVHDQITVRICRAYFTVFHPHMFSTRSLTLLAIGWGTIATWWVGALLGIALAIASRAGGSAQKRAAAELIRPVALLLACMAVCAIAAGSIGYFWGQAPPSVLDVLPANAQRTFVADLWAHTASYLCGLAGGVVLCLETYRRRLRASI